MIYVHKFVHISFSECNTLLNANTFYRYLVWYCTNPLKNEDKNILYETTNKVSKSY